MTSLQHRAIVLGLALVVDWLAREPPEAIHPVVWIGRVSARLAGRPSGRPARDLARGTAAVGFTVSCAAFLAWLAARAVARPPPIAATMAEALLLKPSFAFRALVDATERVAERLDAADLVGARAALRSLVSRDTAELDAPLAAAAAIESVAENLADSLVAPVLAYLLAGLPGAYGYRAVNTLDAMIGYRGEHEWLGKTAARLDDVVNLAPARATAMLIVLAALLRRERGPAAAAVAWRDHGRAASPNAGWPMAAMAGAIDARLEKVGHYVLNARGAPPDARDVRRAVRLVLVAAALGAGLVAALALRAP